MKKLYRYDITSFTDGDSTVHLCEFEITRETEKSFIVDELKSWGKSPVVSKTANKRFAYPTKEEALHSLKMRKSAQFRILTNQLQICASSVRFLKDKTVDDVEDKNWFTSSDSVTPFRV